LLYVHPTIAIDSQCFEYILDTPPDPLSTANIYTQIGYVYEISGDYVKARDSFEMVLREEPANTKVLLQLGFIHSIPQSPIRDLDKAEKYIDKALTIGIPRLLGLSNV
jgi:general transcriptional corepressor CYC8